MRERDAIMTWLLFSMITVGAFGVYGVLLHTGIMSMADPVNGRYKAFLFVGVAYLLTAVVGSLIMLKLNGVEWNFPAKGMMWATLAGIAFGQAVPNVANWGLDFAMIATFIGIAVPMMRTRPQVASALVAAVIALLTWELPYKLGLIAAALAGIVVGVWLERRAERQLQAEVC